MAELTLLETLPPPSVLLGMTDAELNKLWRDEGFPALYSGAETKEHYDYSVEVERSCLFQSKLGIPFPWAGPGGEPWYHKFSISETKAKAMGRDQLRAYLADMMGCNAGQLSPWDGEMLASEIGETLLGMRRRDIPVTLLDSTLRANLPPREGPR